MITYTVKKGDSLWKIADQFLGSGNRYNEIMKASGITDATINVGQKLLIPENSDVTALGAAVKECLNDIQKLPSFKKVVKLI